MYKLCDIIKNEFTLYQTEKFNIQDTPKDTNESCNVISGKRWANISELWIHRSKSNASSFLNWKLKLLHYGQLNLKIARFFVCF